MINIQKINEQLRHHIPGFEVCRTGDNITSNFDIQYDLDFKPRNYCLNIKSPKHCHVLNLKVDLDSNLKEIYPTMSLDGTFSHIIPSNLQKITAHYIWDRYNPYGSYDVSKRIIDNLYKLDDDNKIVSGITLVKGWRTDLNWQPNRTYYMIERSQFDKLTNIIDKSLADFVISSDPSLIILYYDLYMNLQAFLLEWPPSSYDTSSWIL